MIANSYMVGRTEEKFGSNKPDKNSPGKRQRMGDQLKVDQPLCTSFTGTATPRGGAVPEFRRRAPAAHWSTAALFLTLLEQLGFCRVDAAL